MCDEYLIILTKDAVAKASVPAGATAGVKDGPVALAPAKICGVDQIDVGDAKKVFEKFFRERAVAASAAGSTRARSLTRNPV
jgi:hypothetical protein